MKDSLLAISLLLLACISVSNAVAEPAANSGWKLAYETAFTGGQIDEGLCITFGQGEIKDGKLVIAPEKHHGTPSKRVWVTVDNLRFPGDVRMEITAALTPTRGNSWMQLGLGLASDGFPQADQVEDWTHGYYLTVGARGNTSALLLRQNKPVESTVVPRISIAAGQDYQLVAQREGSALTLTIDGRQIFSYEEQDKAATDPAVDNHVGIFTRYNTLTITRMAVYTKGRVGELISLPTDRPAGPEVTLKGIAQCARSAAPTPRTGDHSIRFYAYDGTPKVKATMDALIKEHYADPMDVEAAENFQKEMDRQALYHVSSNRLSRQEHYLIHQCARQCAITGVEYIQNGQRHIWPTKIETIQLDYPQKMLQPDKPLVMPAGAPIEVKVTDTLTMKCVPIPAGRFLQGSPFFVTRWQDEYPHEVVQTRPFYMAEHPVTQEMFQAVMGTNPSRRKLTQAPVENVPYADVMEFCRKLSEKNGKTIRLATDAEWEYAARVGNSNPCIVQRYEAQNTHSSDNGEPVRPVKSKAPNAWGLYNMIGAGWEADSDYAAANAREKQVDPHGPPADDPWVRDYGEGLVRKSKGGGYFSEDYRPSMHGAWDAKGLGYEGVTTFRFVVEAETRAQ